MTLVSSPFCTERLTWVLVLQILQEYLQSMYPVLKFFQILFTYTTEVKKRTKISKLLTKINSIESYTRDMVLKFLPEASHEINILQKNYQALYPPDKISYAINLT